MTDKDFINKFDNKEYFTTDELSIIASKCDVNGIFKVADRQYKLTLTNYFNSNDLDDCIYTIYRLKERKKERND